jgi:hypothetical protein
MTQRTFDDPVLELSIRLGDGPEDVLDLADVTDSDAEIVLSVLDEVEAEEQAAGMVATLRRQGHTL